MSDEQKRGPDYVAYNVRDRGKDKDPMWDRVGVAFEHKDREGFDVLLDSFPMDGRVTLRKLREEEFKEQRRAEPAAPEQRRERGRRR